MAVHIWTPTTLEAHIVGELHQDRNAAGGAVPTRLTSIVQDAYTDLWEMYDWNFARKLATLSITAADTTEQLPTDFAKLDQKWLDENNRNGAIKFTTDPQRYITHALRYIGQTGYPRVAIIEADPSVVDNLRWMVRFVPTASANVAYAYYYILVAPALDAAKSPMWSRPFHTGWALLALSYAQRAFTVGDRWKDTRALFEAWLVNAKEVNNETLSSDTPVIRDGYGDIMALPSVQHELEMA